MKRLLEWKQRMLQSPLTRKGGGGSGGTRSSERSTPTHGMERESSIPSPVLPIQSKSINKQPILHALFWYLVSLGAGVPYPPYLYPHTRAGLTVATLTNASLFFSHLITNLN